MRSIRRLLDDPLAIVIIIIMSFILMVLSIYPIKVKEISVSPFFVFDIIPLVYWFGIIAITGTLFFMIRSLGTDRSILLFIFSSILFIIIFRSVFPIVITTVPAYEPDAANYMNVVSLWANRGLDFGVEGNYQHNFPLSFFIGFLFVKLGVSVDSFFRFAPFVIYALEIILLYLIVKEVLPDTDKKIAAVSAFLFAFSSNGYWLSVHYCPDLVGSLLYFLCLYMSIKFAKNGEYSLRSFTPVLITLFLLILAHHISTLYIIVTFAGLALSTWFFKPPQFKGKATAFVTFAIYTYTLWFAYGSLMYPSFFNVYVYFSGFESVGTLQQGAGIDNTILFAIYPTFLGLLFTLGVLQLFKINNIRNFHKLIILKNPKKFLSKIKNKKNAI